MVAPFHILYVCHRFTYNVKNLETTKLSIWQGKWQIGTIIVLYLLVGIAIWLLKYD